MLKFIGFYNYTVVLTYASLVSAVIGMIQASKGSFSTAVICLLVSGLCDAFDGAVARTKKDRTEDEKAFGIQVDSLVDAISFGVAPAFLCYCMGVNGMVGQFILFCFCLCGVIRLAFFNVLETNRQKTEDGCTKSYRGLPITSSSIILPITYCLHYFLSPLVFVIVLHIVMGMMAFLFVLDFSVPKYDFKRILVKLKLIEG